MDIEELNKSQIVLLTLLVSFVTSIATGIVTVALMDQAPPAITQTINRVVERTIERVVPAEEQQATVITTERTVVVKESDLIADAVSRNSATLVRLFTGGADPEFIGFGTVVSKDGLVVTGSSVIADVANVSVMLRNNVTMSAKIVHEQKGLSLLQILSSDSEAGETVAPKEYSAATIASVADLKLGQTVLALSGASQTRVASGIISAFDTTEVVPDDAETDAPVTEVRSGIVTNIGLQGSIGAPLLNVDGGVIGVHLVSGGVFVPATEINKILGAFATAETPVETTPATQ